MSLPPGFLDELRSRVSLAQLVGRRLSWDARKSNPARGDYWAPCPFHQEKTASFHVDDAKGFYYCFGCHAKGDAVDFLRATDNLDFIEAVEALAREAAVPMPARDPAAAARSAAAQGLAEAMEAAVQFYRLQLATARAAEARAYLDRRGLAPATRDRFELGFAPDARTTLLDHLTDKGFPRERLAEAGLVGLPKDGGGPYDRFRGRIMFPIRDARGRAIAFGARALKPDQEPKYLNSPETPLFDKSRTLYNIGPARTAAARTGTAVVVEGYMDVIALSQAGIEHTVAPLGTAITEAQLEALWKLAPEPVVALDGDRAGLDAAQRLIDLALPLLVPGRSLRFALMPRGHDPDDVARAGGARAVQTLLDASRPIVDLLWSRETEGQVLDSPDRIAALRARLKAHLARIRDGDLRDIYNRELRDRYRTLHVPAREPTAERSGRSRATRWPAATAHAATATRASLLARAPDDGAAEARVRESAILAACLHHPAVARDFEDRLERMAFRCADLAAIRDALLSALAESLDSGEAVAAAVATRLGRDPLPGLTAIGQVRANPHLGPAADPGQAARAIAEELARHAAAEGMRAEVRDAAHELTRDTADSFTWRLREAAEAAHDATSRPLADAADAEAEAEAARSAALQDLIDREIWKKPRRR
jgi:DNA primase